MVLVWYGKILFIVVFNHVAVQCPSIASEQHNHNMLIYSQHSNDIKKEQKKEKKLANSDD